MGRIALSMVSGFRASTFVELFIGRLRFNTFPLFFCFYQQDVASYEMNDNEDNDSVIPQRRGQVSQEQEDLVVKG